MKLVVKTPVCPLWKTPRRGGELADELLFGMGATVLAPAGQELVRLRTDYGYEGYAPTRCLVPARGFGRGEQAVVTAPFSDVLPRPDIRAPARLTLPRGSLVCPLGPPRDAWQEATLPGGGRGWLRGSHLGPRRAPELPEKELRRRLMEAALSYLGAPYRWGGKTPRGIDCSGLVFMAYWLNGLTVYRDAQLKPGFDLVEIDPAEKQGGDVLFFPGHVALYLGDGRYVHATARSGSDGAALSSLDPAAPDYREDLARSITQVGSYRGFHKK